MPPFPRASDHVNEIMWTNISEQSLMRVRAFDFKYLLVTWSFYLGKRDVKEKGDRAGERAGGGQKDHFWPQEEEHWAKLDLNLQIFQDYVYVMSILAFQRLYLVLIGFQYWWICHSCRIRIFHYCCTWCKKGHPYKYLYTNIYVVFESALAQNFHHT